MPGPLALIENGAPGDHRVLALRGEFDADSTGTLRDWLDRASDGGRRPVVVDLGRVGFLAVQGLYVLCDEQRRMARNHARLTVVCGRRQVLQLLDICRLEDILAVVSDVGDVTADAWSAHDDERAERLEAWLERHRRSA